MRKTVFFFGLAAVAAAACSSNSSSESPDSDGGTQDSMPASTCVAPTGAGTKHNSTIAASETWKAADSPHILTFGITVAEGATLTIEPCAEVRIQDGYSIVVKGNLLAAGTATTPIKIGADDATKPWSALQVFAPGTISLAYATLSGGGVSSSNAYGVLEARGDQLAPAQEILKVDHVTINGAATYGVSLRAGGAFTKDSQALTVNGCLTAPMRINPRLASNIPGGTYTGNVLDAIVVETEAYGEINYEDVVFHDRGVPYRIGGPTTLGGLVVGPKHFKMTIEAGVTMAFKKAGVLKAADSSGATGVIVATGAAGKPVVFTSAEQAPAAGDWTGIQLGNAADPAFKLDHVEIRYAGGPSQSSGHHCQPNPTIAGAQSMNDDAALAIYHQPSGVYLTNSVIANSAGDAVDLAYSGTYVDFKPGNMFTGIAACQVTFPLPITGLCPQMGCP